MAERILCIVESPNKVKTIKDCLKGTEFKDVIVMASVGHITSIADTGKYNMGIDPDNNFEAKFIITPGKEDIVKKLKDQVKAADIVYLCTDSDREGEAISWHLINQLKIPKSKYRRATYHEVTKQAILNALKNYRTLDEDLASAAITRAKLDKIVGYRLSGVARNSVGARSAGRCQSAGLKLITDREEEIQNFKVEQYYELFLHFVKNKTEFQAKYFGTDKEEIKSFKTLDECKKVSEECKPNPYIILKVEHKDSKENPKPPFITSTFQQEVTKRLGLSVKQAMDCAQKLFEGVDIGGQHQGLFTYHRTDCSQMAPEFLPVLQEFVENKFGKKYYAPVKEAKKVENAQEGHEALRVVDINITPEIIDQYISDPLLQKVYRIVWQRTVACGMQPAVIANTIYTIQNGRHRFTMTSKELKFDGYRKIYNYSDDDDSEGLIKETFAEGEILQDTSLEAALKETKPPARYSEASFIKALEKCGIGRPSTYASILGTILDEKRGYTKVEDKCILPTPLGMKLSEFLANKFSDVISLEYTALLEKDLDLIAQSKLNSVEFLTNFYGKLDESINKVQPSTENEVCPKCGKPLVIRKGKYGLFAGCSGWPDCSFIRNIKKSKS